MLPELVTVGPVTVHTYGLLVALGILSAVILAELLHRRSGGQPGRIVDMALMVVLAGLLGARLMFVLVNLDYYSRFPMEIFLIWKGGLVFYGGLLGGMAAFIVLIRVHRLPLWEMLDIGAAAVALGHAIGRLGCFTAGCCYGQPTGVPWAVTFTDPRCLATEVLNEPVHPTQLYSFFFLAALTVFLVWLRPRRSFAGQMTASYLILYGLFRFGVEFLRGDPRGTMTLLGATLSTSQWASIVAVLAGAVLYVILSRRKLAGIASHSAGSR
ncbi:MAG: prolipoprotein diacylglyceryl transferase [bacterium]|nr:MAG: prolipoprotein diacylglyceryl transferase [bacterium]